MIWAMEEEAATEQGHSMQGFLTMKKLFKQFGAVTNQIILMDKMLWDV